MRFRVREHIQQYGPRGAGDLQQYPTLPEESVRWYGEERINACVSSGPAATETVELVAGLAQSGFVAHVTVTRNTCLVYGI